MSCLLEGQSPDFKPPLGQNWWLDSEPALVWAGVKTLPKAWFSGSAEASLHREEECGHGCMWGTLPRGWALGSGILGPGCTLWLSSAGAEFLLAWSVCIESA